MRQLLIRRERWPLRQPLITSNTHAADVDIVYAEIRDGNHIGRGEACGVYFRGETAATIQAQMAGATDAIQAGAGRDALQSLLPAGGARNALDCALWELAARQAGTSVAAMARLAAVPLRTVTTISLADPATMAEAACAIQGGLLKLKLGADDPVACVAAVRRARPDARIIVDANTAWTVRQLGEVASPLAALGVRHIEQPCRPEDDDLLDKAAYPLPLCADESCLTRADLPRITRGFSMICIKLDKTGGLTEAIALAHAARETGLRLMIGNMLGTSLAMAPLSLLGAWCDWVDIDGPLLLARDRSPAMQVTGDLVAPLVPMVWG
jgi:L-Ala-D/L-Glu epimerase